MRPGFYTHARAKLLALFCALLVSLALPRLFNLQLAPSTMHLLPPKTHRKGP
jgi:hypothetical protein